MVGREHANGEETEEREVVEGRVPADDEETARPSGEEVWRKVATADVDVLSDEKEVVEGRAPADDNEVSCACFLTQIRARHLKKIVLTEN